MSQPDAAVSREVRTPDPSGTALASGDWQAFSGPSPRWARSIERMERESEARVTAAVGEVMRGETFSDVDRRWLAFLQQNMPVAAFAFNECGRILESMSRRSPEGPIADGLGLQAAMQYRQAQSIVLYIADMEQRMGAMPMLAARTRWRTDRQWLPAHHFLEQAATCADWGESLVAVNVCFEPLLGQLLRREFAMRRGPVYGDVVTPTVAETGQAEFALTRRWTVAAIRFLVTDEDHGEANRALLQGWVDRQLPPAIEAMGELAALAAQLGDGGPHEPAIARVVDDQRGLLADLGLVT